MKSVAGQLDTIFGPHLVDEMTWKTHRCEREKERERERDAPTAFIAFCMGFGPS